ncbi:MAG TPA: glycosyltransferase [Nitrososphaerales archaeon]|nr:glycosyltransferase [Nitrososphaerales archaeon]
MDSPRVSVVLPVYNSETDVLASIGEIEKQTFGSFELIVVDDGSTDGTFHVANDYAGGKTGIRVLKTEHLGPSHARNAGLASARGDTVIFVESDCVYDSSYISKAVAQLEQEPSASAVCLTGAPLITRSTLATRCIDIENKVQHKQLSEGKIKPFYAWVFRKADIVKLGGFDEKLFQAEDRDLFRRMKAAGYHIALVPGVNWQHRRNQTTSELARKWFLRGRTKILYTLKHGLTFEALRTMLPLWATVTGVVTFVFSPLIGTAILVLVAAVFIAYSVRVAALSWSLVDQKRAFLGYPLFALVRNFSTALGYTTAIPYVISKKVRGKEISWDSL